MSWASYISALLTIDKGTFLPAKFHCDCTFTVKYTALFKLQHTELQWETCKVSIFAFLGSDRGHRWKCVQDVFLPSHLVLWKSCRLVSISVCVMHISCFLFISCSFLSWLLYGLLGQSSRLKWQSTVALCSGMRCSLNPWRNIRWVLQHHKKATFNNYSITVKQNFSFILCNCFLGAKF